MQGFAVYYIEANVVCIIIFGILLIHNLFNIDRQEKQVKFDRALSAFILYFAADCFWAAMTDGMIPRTGFTVVLDDFLLYLFMAGITYFWLEFVMAFEQVPHRARPINKFAVLFPFLVSTVALILTYLLAPQVLIDDALDTRVGYSIFLIAVPDIYMAAVLFYTIRKSRAEEDLMEKRKHLFIGFLPLMTIVGGLIETFLFPSVPIFCFTCLILMLVFFINSLESRISMDPLTGLNNRGQLQRYLSQKANFHPEGRLTIVIMIDINDFKAINDTFGHAEGDKALILVADALKKELNRHSMPSFLGRYGGDEFILIIHPVDDAETGQLIRALREEIALQCREADKPYTITIGAGCDGLMGSEDSIQNCILRADKKLYLDKEYSKLQNKK